MSGIRIRCPETGAEVETGFDSAVIEVLTDVYFTLEDCPRCGHAHGWSVPDALPAEGPATSVCQPPDRTGPVRSSG